MIKTLTIIEIKVGERVYHFQCSPDSPLGEIHDVLCMMKQQIVGQINEAQKNEEAKKEGS